MSRKGQGKVWISPAGLARGTSTTRYPVSLVRKILRMMEGSPQDEDFIGPSIPPLKYYQIERITGVRADLFKDWVKKKKYREATYEYDPDFQYDVNDLEDRAVVAHALCKVEHDPQERMELMLAVVGLHSDDIDPKGKNRA